MTKVPQTGLDEAMTTLFGVITRSKTKKPHEAMATEELATMFDAGLMIVGSVATDLKRIADATEKLSAFEIPKAGELLHIGMSMTSDEIDTLRALRDGVVKVVKS